MKVSPSNKKRLNRNPFNEKLIHRFYLEALYFFSTGVSKNKLIPTHIHPKITARNLALVVPEDARAQGYRPDFTLYFKDYTDEVPVEVKWKASEFNKSNQTEFIAEHNGFLVVLDKDTDLDVPIVQIDPKEFQDWMAKRIFTLSRDSLSSKDILNQGSNKWIVGLRGPDALKNFTRMQNATTQHFWAFKNNSYVTNQIFNLQKNDDMIFLFFKSPGEAMGMTSNKPNKTIEITGWAEARITEPYYICLDGDQASFFEEIRKENDEIISVSQRKWVHFIDFKLSEFQSGLNLIRPRGILDPALINSSNQGGALTSIPQNVYEDILSYLKTSG